ncbi:MAG: c-type cytochrome [Micropepsaceae bacterium]
MGIRSATCILTAALLASCVDDMPQIGPQASSEVAQAQIEDGKGVAEGNCSACHAVETTGQSPNPKAPLFRTILKRYNPEMLASELVEGMRVTHDPMPQFRFRPDAADDLIAYLRSIQVTDPGQALVEERCSRCHAVGKSGTSPYPGAQPFRKLGQRWRRSQLREALLVGIIAEHDAATTRVPPMKLTPAEADAFLVYLDSIATNENPPPKIP